MSKKGGTRGGVWYHSQDGIYIVGVVVGCRNSLVGTVWANSCLHCTNVVKESFTHLVGASFLAVKFVWAQK